MALAIGARLGPYEILSPLGAGGMGEVYRARDAKLGREVAIKVLPEAFASDGERLARFRREAQMLAALNHPHIEAIYGREESRGVEALVLELVKGETLSERLAAGPLPVEEALEVARQIADALEAAHEKGIVHRDLKPSNVKLTPEGKVKVLDIGLAKALTGEPSLPDVSHSPTLTAVATKAGVVFGTAAYMSPEQARGKPVDKRADIWAFGCVLYEMLAGRRAFDGQTVSDVLAAILTRDPDWATLPGETPPSVRRVLKRCLDRNSKTRFQDVADARPEMDETPERPGGQSAVSAPTWRRAIPWTLAAVFGLVAGAALLRPSREARSPAPPVVRISKTLEGIPVLGSSPAISPDGTCVAFWSSSEELGQSEIFVRRFPMTEEEWRISTAGGQQPSWSRDGKEIFFVALDDRLMAAPVSTRPSFSSGAPQPLYASGLKLDVTANQYVASADGQRFLMAVPTQAIDSGLFRVLLNWRGSR
jgi:eukaryotic-like serine/threonine-protein kinase